VETCDIISGIVNISDVSGDILDTVEKKMPVVRLQKLCYSAQVWHLVSSGK
jgi:hypothetical protein